MWGSQYPRWLANLSAADQKTEIEALEQRLHRSEAIFQHLSPELVSICRGDLMSLTLANPASGFLAAKLLIMLLSEGETEGEEIYNLTGLLTNQVGFADLIKKSYSVRFNRRNII